MLSERLVDLLDPVPGETVLELAAGPGDTGFLALPRLRPGGLLVSSDVAPEMVDAARRRGRELGHADVEYRVLDAAALDLDDASVDGVLCRFGLMLVEDVDAAFAELRRVLRPDGRAAIAVWAAPERNDWITAGARAAIALGLVERPPPDAPGPFRLADVARLRQVVSGATLELASLEEVPVLWRAGSLDEWWDTTLDTSRMLSALVADLDAATVASLRGGAEERLSQYVAADGSFAVPGVAVAALLRPA
jgi:SAM-dependent methyltransferase